MVGSAGLSYEPIQHRAASPNPPPNLSQTIPRKHHRGQTSQQTDKRTSRGKEEDTKSSCGVAQFSKITALAWLRMKFQSSTKRRDCWVGQYPMREGYGREPTNIFVPRPSGGDPLVLHYERSTPAALVFEDPGARQTFVLPLPLLVRLPPLPRFLLAPGAALWLPLSTHLPPDGCDVRG